MACVQFQSFFGKKLIFNWENDDPVMIDEIIRTYVTKRNTFVMINQVLFKFGKLSEPYAQ